MLRAPTISWLTICPLGQPEKAIGLEPQIELWLAFLLPPNCLSHQKPKASSRQQHESAKKENPKNRSTLHGLESWAQIFAPSSRGRAFSLDSPLYRTRLPYISNNVGPVDSFFERTTPFTPGSGLPCPSLTRCFDDHGSLVIFRSASVRPKHLFDPYFDHDY